MGAATTRSKPVSSGTSVDALMPDLLKLSVDERLELIERLEDSLPDEVAPSEVPDWHIEILKKRLAEADANPGQGKPWREVLGELRKRI